VPRKPGKSRLTPIAKTEESAKLLQISFVRPDFHVGVNSWSVLWKWARERLPSAA